MNKVKVCNLILFLLFLFLNCNKLVEQPMNGPIDSTNNNKLIQETLSGTITTQQSKRVNLTTALVENDTAWIGTQGLGLVKYLMKSGKYSFINIDGLNINPMEFDSDENKWVCADGNLYCVSKGEVTKAHINAQQVIKDEQGSVWAIDYESYETAYWISIDSNFHIYKRTGNEWELFTFNNIPIPLSYFSCIYVKDTADIWVAGGTNCTAIAHYDGSKWILYDSQHNPFQNGPVIMDILRNDDGQIYFGTASGVIVFDGQKWQNLNLPSNASYPLTNYVRELFKSSDTIWMVSGQGIISLKDSTWFNLPLTMPSTPDFKLFYNHMLTYYMGKSLFKDTNGVLWSITPSSTSMENFGDYSSFNLLSAQSESTISLSPQTPGFPFPTEVTGLVFDKQGNLWIGTSSSGLYLLKNDSLIQFNPTTGNFPDSNITSICLDSAGGIWVSTAHELIAVNSNSNQIIPYQMPLANILSISAGSLNRIWVCGEGGVVEFNGVIVNHYSSVNSKLSTDNITCAVEDKHGTLFIGTDRGGMCSLNDTQWMVYNQYNSTFDGSNILEISVDNQNAKWVITANTIYTFSADTFSKPISINEFIESTGMPVMSFAIEGDSTYWMGLGSNGTHTMKGDGNGGILTKIIDHTSYSMLRFNAPRVILPESHGQILIGTNETLEYFTEN